MAASRVAMASAARAPTPNPAPAVSRALLHPRLLMAAVGGDGNLLKDLLQVAEPRDEDGATMEGDSLLHVLAASGDTQNYVECAEMVYHKASRLLDATNTRGDTPLHCAASAGNANMISCLIRLADTWAEAFVRMRNKRGETALHHAVRATKNNKACIDGLLEKDPLHLACIPHDNNSSPSPLYLAISMGEVQIARYLYDKTGGRLSYSGPGGRNVLHGAVSRGQEEALSMVLKWLGVSSANKPQQQQQQQQGGQGHADLLRLLRQLTSQRDDENGSTPLHLAASLPGLPAPCMFKPHPRFWGWSGSPAWLLLKANESMAYQPDKEGQYPIHVAAGAGSLRVVCDLLWRCPDCATLRDAKGRTFLHIAVEEGRYSVIRYVCDQIQMQRKPQNPCARLVRYVCCCCCCCQMPIKQNPAAARLLSSILNAQDINGDTPLHRAVHAGDWAIFLRLVCNLRVRLDVQNNKGMRPIDVAWSKMPLWNYYPWDSRLRIRKYLIRVGAPYGETRGDCFNEKHILSKQDEEKMSADLTASAQVLCLFSVLITTVTFASAFTLPGGYRSAGDAAATGDVAGTPVLAGQSYAFDAFVLSDSLAFMCSLLATSFLLYAGVPCGTLNTRFSSINLAYTLMWHAGRSLVAAFGLGLYIVLLPVARTIGIAVAVLMAINAFPFIKGSEGINSMFVIGSLPIQPRCEAVIRWLIFVLLDRFWSYMIIFGLPAIRKWARLH